MATNKSRGTKYYANMLALIFHLRNHYMTSQLTENKNDNLIHHIVNDELLPSKNWQKSLKCVALPSINTPIINVLEHFYPQRFSLHRLKSIFFISQDSKKSSEDNLSRFFYNFLFQWISFYAERQKLWGMCIFGDLCESITKIQMKGERSIRMICELYNRLSNNRAIK